MANTGLPVQCCTKNPMIVQSSSFMTSSVTSTVPVFGLTGELDCGE